MQFGDHSELQTYINKEFMMRLTEEAHCIGYELVTTFKASSDTRPN